MKAKSREQKLLERIRVLEQLLEAAPLAVRALPSEYVVELGSLASIAWFGVSRPEDRGYTMAAHAESRPPAYNQDAAVELGREQDRLRARAHALLGVVQRFDPGVGAGVDAESNAAGAGQSYQTKRWA